MKLALLFLAGRAAGHGIMTIPTPRTGAGLNGDTVIKLTPFSNARSEANNGCGGTLNNDPGFDQNLNEPENVYTPGQSLGVQWDITIPHEIDNEDTGVRIAIHYGDSDSFENNILVGCLDGEDGCDETDSQGNYINRATAGARSRLVNLPADKVCNYCVIQWVWAARADGGYYMTCADIAITADGLKPDYDNLIETDGNNNGLPDGVASGGETSAPESSVDSTTIGAVAAVIVGIVVLGGLFLYCKKKGFSGPSMPKLSGGGGGGGGGLPPGWTAAVDPASGRTYYVNSATGQTSWTPPAAAAAPPSVPPPGALGMSLPPGWQSATDPASGRTYYVNQVTGATSWEVPRV